MLLQFINMVKNIYDIIIMLLSFSSVPSVDSSIPVTIEQYVTGDMVEITMLVNVSNKLNYV